MVKGRSRTTGWLRLRKEQALAKSQTGLVAPDGRFVAGGVVAPDAVVVVESRQQRRHQERMAVKGYTAIKAGRDVANVVEDSSYTDLAGSGLVLEDGKTSNAGGAE